MPGVSAYFSSRLSFLARTKTTTKQLGLPGLSYESPALIDAVATRSREARRLSRDHEDAIDATRRDGPDTVRNSSRPRLMETIHEDGVRFNEDAASRTLLGELLRREVRVVAPVQQQFNFPPVLVPVIVRVF